MFENYNICAAREHNEDFKDYKKRIKINKTAVKEFLKGKIIWDSKRFGTYKNKK